MRVAWRTAIHCNTLQRTATHCNTLQHTATHCNTLQHTATHCQLSMRVAWRTLIVYTYPKKCKAHWYTHCNTLQHTATHCNTLQQTCRIWTSYTCTHTLHIPKNAKHIGRDAMVYVCYDSFICGTPSDMTYWYRVHIYQNCRTAYWKRRYNIRVLWRIHMCVTACSMTYWYRVYLYYRIEDGTEHWKRVRATMYVWCDSFVYWCVARLIYSCVITRLSCTHIHALQHTATYYNKHAAFEPRTHVHTLHTLQHTATHCYTLQHTATHMPHSCLVYIHTHCNALQHIATHYNTRAAFVSHTHIHTLQHTATYCNTLQHTATHCNTLQHTATHCNTQSHTATPYNIHAAFVCVTWLTRTSATTRPCVWHDVLVTWRSGISCTYTHIHIYA